MLNRSLRRVVRGVAWRLAFAADRLTRSRWYMRDAVDRCRASADVSPSVALVVVGRNDNYGGDFRARLAATLDWNLRFPFSEAIYVEWNPLPDRPSDGLWLVDQFPNLRVYSVSPEQHSRCCTNPKMPMMEYFAKNIGIRRAQANWICLVNADVLIGPDVFARMKRLYRRRVYGTHTVNIRWHGGSFSPCDFVGSKHSIGEFSADNHLLSVSGDFILAERDLWHRARGYDESLTDRRISCDGHGVAQLYHHGGRPRVLGTHYHLDHPESCRNAVQDHQGRLFDPWLGVPYQNREDWGFAGAVERPTGERRFYLE